MAIAFVDGALQAADSRLPDISRWDLLRALETNLFADQQPVLARAVLDRIYAEQLVKLGAEHPNTLRMASQLGVAFYKSGLFNKALPLEEKVLAARGSKLGADHPDTLTSMNNLAVPHSKLGQHARSDALYAVVIDKSIRVLGPDHPGLASLIGDWVYELKKRGLPTPILDKLSAQTRRSVLGYVAKVEFLDAMMNRLGGFADSLKKKQ